MAIRTLEEILADLRERVDRLERRRGAGGGGLGLPWGAKSGIVAHPTAYRSEWARGADSGGDVDAHSIPDGIRIERPGTYEVRLTMGGDAALALNGDSAAFQARSDTQATMVGVWSPDHYVGQLNTGDIITAGPASLPSTIPTGPEPGTGSLIVRRIA